MQSRFSITGWKLVDLLFPPCCAGCGQWGERYCISCISKTKIIQGRKCSICGEPSSGEGERICKRCQTITVYFTAVRSWAYFEDPLQKAIHKLKYKNDRSLGEVLAKPLIFLQKKYSWKIDSITAIPLDAKRLKERGFNQSVYLAKPISWETGIKYNGSSVKRIKQTRSQVGLSSCERTNNMTGAFLADSKVVGGRSILLIDDVITTGATINACAKALIEAGANQVYGLTLARATHL